MKKPGAKTKPLSARSATPLSPSGASVGLELAEQPPSCATDCTPARVASGEFRQRGNPSRLAQLPQEQLTALHKWLFEERLKYAVVRARLKEQFGFHCHVSQLCRYFQQHSEAQAGQRTPAGEELLLDAVIMHGGVPLRIQLSTPRKGQR